MVTFDEFKKLEIRVGRILTAEDHPNADKLYVVTVDMGEDRKKTLIAEIREHYKKEDLPGKLVIVMDNLQPATIRGVESCGMILAAKDGPNLTLLALDKEVALGSLIS